MNDINMQITGMMQPKIVMSRKVSGVRVDFNLQRHSVRLGPSRRMVGLQRKDNSSLPWSHQSTARL